MAAKQSNQVPNKNNGAIETVKLRNEFYRDNFRTLALAAPVLAFALVLSIVLNVFLATREPSQRYFTVDGAGRVIPVRALTEPYVTDTFLTNWVSENVTRAFSMDPLNYRRQAAEMEPNFTEEGYAAYIDSLKESGVIEFMTKNLLISSAVAQGAPVIVEKGVANGLFFWKLQMPILVQYRSAQKGTEKRRMVNVTVVRRQTLENPLGISISQMVAFDI
jgi:intracellular multiplication protein IcmL